MRIASQYQPIIFVNILSVVSICVASYAFSRSDHLQLVFPLIDVISLAIGRAVLFYAALVDPFQAFLFLFTIGKRNSRKWVLADRE